MIFVIQAGTLAKASNPLIEKGAKKALVPMHAPSAISGKAYEYH